MSSMTAGPQHVIDHIRINAELINTPALGVDNNVAHTTVQLNIAPAQPSGSCTCQYKSCLASDQITAISFLWSS